MNISLTLTLAARNLPALADALSAAGLLDDIEVAATPTKDTPSAMVTSEKQAAAIASTAAGKAAKVEKAPKEPKTPVEALQQAVDKEKAETPKPPVVRTYETSGIAPKVAQAVTKDRDAVVALLKSFNAEKDGKQSAKFLTADQFDDFEAAIDKILTPSEDLG